MPTARVRDIDVYYETRGSGPRLLYISGTGGDLRRMNPLDNPLLTDHFEVLAYDQRGLGRTSKPAADYTMADYGDDAAALLDAVGWERCRVIGVSFGGMVAQEFALRHPQRIERLVLCCTSTGGPGRPSYPLHEVYALPPEERIAKQMGISDVRRDAAWQEAHPEQAAQVREQLLTVARAVEADPELVEGRRRQLEARRHHDTYDRLPSLTMPVFVAGGMFDGIAPPENLEALAGQTPGAQLEFFEGGHGFFREAPEAMPRIVQWLLAEE